MNGISFVGAQERVVRTKESRTIHPAAQRWCSSGQASRGALILFSRVRCVIKYCTDRMEQDWRQKCPSIHKADTRDYKKGALETSGLDIGHTSIDVPFFCLTTMGTPLEPHIWVIALKGPNR